MIGAPRQALLAHGRGMSSPSRRLPDISEVPETTASTPRLSDSVDSSGIEGLLLSPSSLDPASDKYLVSRPRSVEISSEVM